jgi:hypothetical protein
MSQSAFVSFDQSTQTYLAETVEGHDKIASLPHAYVKRAFDNQATISDIRIALQERFNTAIEAVGWENQDRLKDTISRDLGLIGGPKAEAA